MAKKAPGKHYRRGMSLLEAAQIFADERKTEQMFIEARWPNGIACPFCGGTEKITRRPSRPNKPFRCGDCKGTFSVKTNTVMHDSNLPLSKWGLAIYLLTTSLKGVSSMKLHRDLNITQKSAWHLAHRIRKSWESGKGFFEGPVQADETYIGGKWHGRGFGVKGKAIVAGLVDEATNKIKTEVLPSTKKPVIQDFVLSNVAPDATLYSDGHHSYKDIPLKHEEVNHAFGEYVRGQVTTNSIESHWAMLKRGIVGTYHHVSPKHLHRYVAEFAGRHNNRELDTRDQIVDMIRATKFKRLRYEDLTA